MNNIIKMRWNDKAVKVALSAAFVAGQSDRTLNLKIYVEETRALPSGFAKGLTVKANSDIINTVGGLPKYIKKMLDDAERKEHVRRARIIKTQLTFSL